MSWARSERVRPGFHADAKILMIVPRQSEQNLWVESRHGVL